MSGETSASTNSGPRVYSSVEVTKLTGVTYRQLDYWCRQGYVSDAQKETLGSGRQRVFIWREYVQIRRIASLVGAGMTLTNALNMLSLYDEFKQCRFEFHGGVTITLESVF